MRSGYYINYEEGRVHFTLPETWNAELLERRDASVFCEDLKTEIERALDNPIRSRKIEELAKHASEVAILFDDPQRNTPCEPILNELITRLNKGGIKDERIKLVCAVGTHPVCKPEDLRTKVKEAIYERFKGRIFSHDPFGEHAFIGRTRRGTPVEINKIVHEADLIVGVGSCVPHPSSGYGGGYKIVMPGVTSYETTEKHHITFLRNKWSKVGVLQGNPFFEEIREIGEMAGLSFKIDAVLDEKGNVLKVFAGHPYFAHLAAAKYSGQLHEVVIDKLSDITITSAHPLEIGVQATKALLLAQYVTKKGGIIIWVAPHKKPGNIAPLLEEMAKPITAEQYHRMLLKKGIPDHLKSLGVSYVMQLVHFKEISERFTVIHVTEGLKKEDVEKMGFIHAYTIEEAIRIAVEQIPYAKVHILPSGGSILPQRSVA